MFVGCLGVLIAAGFMTEVPVTLRDRIAPTNEVAGAFVQEKRLPSGETFETKGTYRIRPGRDFTWRTTEPFETLFTSTQKEYVYSNEDEVVKRPLKDLPGFARFASVSTGDFSGFFDSFRALYREEPEGVFHLLAKPRVARLEKLLTRIDLDGDPTNMIFRASLTDGTFFTIKFFDFPR